MSQRRPDYDAYRAREKGRAQKLTRVDEEFGKAVADRLGLHHDNTLEEWSAEQLGDRVLVTMTVMKSVPLDEFNGMRKIAIRRAEQ